MNQLRIYCISDTHNFHNQLIIPPNIDMIIHSGDESNSNIPIINHGECIDFLNWYQHLNVKYKIFVAGNHSTAIYERYISKQEIQERSIIYLEHESVEIEGLKIFGSPYTPTFGYWSFMRDRSKLEPYWEQIPDDTNVLITHGPPKGILDLTENRSGLLNMCGDKSLFNKVIELKPLLSIFGHIHNNPSIMNFGIKKFNETIFANVSCVEDGRRFNNGIINKGIVFTVDIQNKKIIDTEIL